MNWLIKLSVVSILVFSSIFKLIYVEYFEFSLVEKEMSNWYYSSITIHSLVIIEFVLATSILLKSIHIKLISICIFLLSLLYGADAFACNNEGMFSNYFILPLYSKWVVITCSFILIFFSFWLSRITNEKNRNKRIHSVITNLCLALIISVPLLIINPIYVDDFQKNNTIAENPTLSWGNVYYKCEESKINIDSETEVFFAFLSTSCYYCNSAAIRLGVSKRAKLNATQLVLVFPGNIKDTEAFIQRNRCDFPYIRISKDEFRKIAGNEFPAFFKVKDKKETNYYTGRTLNLRELDNLFQLN